MVNFRLGAQGKLSIYMIRTIMKFKDSKILFMPMLLSYLLMEKFSLLNHAMVDLRSIRLRIFP